ncbi:MAG: pyridoxamine 5'-phosphate oxidase family protein [Thermomicrobiales bacterium]
MAAIVSTSGVVSTLEELREVLGMPSQSVIDKQLSHLDRHSRYFIGRSPFILVGTSSREGKCDVSPKGDQPGFVKVIDERNILIPDRPGNRRADTLINLLENPQIGTIFLIPGVEETLRVNGRATITRDQSLLAPCAVAGKSPSLGIIVEVDEVYFHCAKAFKRSSLWSSEDWVGRGDLPSLGEIMAEQLRISDKSGDELNCEIEEAYRSKLY